MSLTNLSVNEFVDSLSSKSAVPGGGGASALVGSLGIALGNMVANLTLGKDKYALVQDDMKELNRQAIILQNDLLELVQKDADLFEPLSKAYTLPEDTEEEKEYKEKVMEEALVNAAITPLEIMEKCGEAICLQEEFAKKGSVLAVSDAGVGAELCLSALKGAYLNVLINTKMMKNREYATNLNEKADALLVKYSKVANEIYEYVKNQLQ